MAGPEKKSGLDLYVRRVLIQHECEELVPPYLRFVKGVVDSADLPLNVSRETLQHNPLLAKIKHNLVNRVLKTLEEMKDARVRHLPQVLQGIRPLPEGRGRPGLRQPRAAGRPAAVRVAPRPSRAKYTTLAKYVEADAGRAEGDLLPDRREPGADRALALPGGVQGARAGGAAADRPDRRVPGRLAARLQGQAASRPPTAASWKPTRTPRKSKKAAAEKFKPRAGSC